MHTAQLGDRVRIKYARVRALTAARPKAPAPKTLEFTVGASGTLPKISAGVVGMVQGQNKRVTLQPSEAYGAIKPKLIREVPRRRFPEHLALKVGQRFTTIDKASGRRRRVTIVQIKPHSVVVDGNHPLAGKVVELDVVLVSVDSSSKTKPGK
jgi:FKBP-type peptidyl-prolyl cis-trans isomerase 2